MSELRRATAVQHTRLERHLDIDARLDSLKSYGALIERLYGFYLPLEQCLAVSVGELGALDFPARRKTPLLSADLSALGLDRAFTCVTDAALLPATTTPERALGVLYVLEGATLGGAIIARRARRRLNLTPTSGAAFFRAYGQASGDRWRAFGSLVEESSSGTAPAQMLLAASECFERMEAWLCL